MSDDPHLPTPLAHGRWAGDRVGRSAREAGASLKTLSKCATLTEQQRHRLGSGSFEWRQPEKQRSQRGGLFWTVFPRGAVQNGAQLDRIAARESEDLLFNAHTSPAMCVELTGGPPVRWFVIFQEMGRSFSKPSKRCEAFPTALNVNPQALCKFRSRKSVPGRWPPTPAESRWRERSSRG